MVEFGWSYDRIDETPFCDLTMIFDYWADHPPVSQLVAAFLGVKPRHKMRYGSGGVFDQDWIRKLDAQLAGVAGTKH